MIGMIDRKARKMTDKLRRKISEKGQVRIPPRFHDPEVSSYLIPEPGTITPDDEIRMIPEDDTPTVTVAGEVLRVQIGTNGQVTLPATFRDLSGNQPGDWVFIEQDADGLIYLTPATTPEDADSHPDTRTDTDTDSQPDDESA
jgi:AbrB family looped-hinge helix DNA binding protein